MASNAPGECCIRGIKHEGTPAGTIQKIGGIDIYISHNAEKTTDKSILFFTDIFGIQQNAQILADDFAKKGYHVVMPDLFSGDPVPLALFAGGAFDLPAWLAKHPSEEVHAKGNIAIKYLREELKVKKLASVGYCFGAKYVVQSLKAGILDVGYVAHPSFVTKEELGAITQPLSIAAAETDEIFTKDLRYESEKILAELGVPYQITLYGAVEHGFAVRGDLSIKKVQFATDQAFAQALNWFDYFL